MIHPSCNFYSPKNATLWPPGIYAANSCKSKANFEKIGNVTGARPKQATLEERK